MHLQFYKIWVCWNESTTDSSIRSEGETTTDMESTTTTTTTTDASFLSSTSSFNDELTKEPQVLPSSLTSSSTTEEEELIRTTIVQEDSKEQEEVPTLTTRYEESVDDETNGFVNLEPIDSPNLLRRKPNSPPNMVPCRYKAEPFPFSTIWAWYKTK